MTSRLFLISVAAVIAVGTLIAPMVNADPFPRGDAALTHLALLRQLSNTAVGEMLDGLPIERRETVRVIPGAVNAGNDLVADAIAAALTAAGYAVQVDDRPLDVAAVAPASPASPPPAEPEEETADDETEGEGDAGDAAGADGSILSALLDSPDTVSGPGSSAGAPVAAAPAAPPPGGQRLVFRVKAYAVNYVSQHRSRFLGPSRVERVATVDVSCRLINRDDEVVAVGHGDAIALDDIAKGKLAAYESGGITPEALTGRGASRYIEPVVVGGIVTGLVYLFYTNQN